MGTLLGKMLSSLRIKRDKYSTYRDKLKEIEKFEDQQKEKPLANKTKRQRGPVKNRKNIFKRRTSKKKEE
ncbi:MAG: hypothetical protein ACK4ND_01965 [Cytophagaceae bacterium]